ncbi:hypothetical protein [Crossiella cryophila]|uniref:Lipoprotein n=1 Tax=Crossiella cryophila TaxID=43355 RepID=A0A7W7FUH8_9PSEU|nr:hypothetical protein [Crossiella cryophila]MBB4678080.1 hypothetical protein [Crossiella cryophila]
MTTRRIAALGLAVLLLAGCARPLSTDWAAAGSFVVVRDGDRKLLVGLDTATAQALPLARLPGTAAPDRPLDTALLTVAARPLILSGLDDGLGAEVLELDRTGRTLRPLRTVPAAQYPTALDQGLLGIGRTVRTYHAPDLDQLTEDTWPEVITTGDGRCLAGTTPNRTGTFRRGAGVPVPLGRGDLPVSISCLPGLARLSLVRDGEIGAPGRTVLVRGSTAPQPFETGPDPRAVRLISAGLAAVDVAKDEGRAIRLIELPGETMTYLSRLG